MSTIDPYQRAIIDRLDDINVKLNQVNNHLATIAANSAHIDNNDEVVRLLRQIAER